MIVGMAIVGCLLANLISRRGICRTLRSQLVTVAMFAGFTAICTVLIFDSSAREFTDWAIGGAAAGSTVILALWVEYVRNQYRFPRSPNPSSESW